MFSVEVGQRTPSLSIEGRCNGWHSTGQRVCPFCWVAFPHEPKVNSGLCRCSECGEHFHFVRFHRLGRWHYYTVTTERIGEEEGGPQW